MRTNSDLFRRAIFNFGDIQTGRKLCEQEVLQINLITKRRAYRYIAAGKREWLYPEKHVDVDHWRKMGDGYLLMPDPRDVYMGGEVMIGYDNGRHDAFNAYGQKPWQQGYEDKERDRVEAAALRRFKAEFAMMQGPKWRGSSHQFMRGGPMEDSEDMTAAYRRDIQKYRAHGRFKRGRE